MSNCACGVVGYDRGFECFDAYYGPGAGTVDGRDYCICSCHHTAPEPVAPAVPQGVPGEEKP